MSSNNTIDPAVLAAERTLAGYLGFDSIVEVHRFSLMWPCLEAFRRILSMLPPTNGELFPPFRASEFASLETTEPGSIMEILIEMRDGVELYINSSPGYNRRRTAEAIRQMPREVWLPDFEEEAELALFPIMRPVQSYSEGDLVPVHRCLCILQYFNLTHGTEASRVEWLELHEALMPEDFEVTSSDIPWWMSNRL
ncbi:hypothetical protein N7541_006163 [Penicillium brevicompactum]|uniref:Uncharacterized protein n=1 Tax=Penicillium brevicompactum TaxID=5074 RepID=A0A9W9R7G8_PENBR|nr:hypothetical protein N7541_006163 [Penicillium brevicompactum]